MQTEIIITQNLALYKKTAEKILYRLAVKGSVPIFEVGCASRLPKGETDRWIQEQEQNVLKKQD